jgi:Tfp pilus assembly protein PilF
MGRVSARRFRTNRPNELAAVAYNRANALAEGGDREAAARAYREAIAASPKFAEAHNNLAMLLRDGGDVAGALGHFRAAARLMPESPQCLVNYGCALLETGRPAEAVGAFDRALARDDAFMSALANLATALRALGDEARAETVYRRILALRPDHVGTRYLLAELLEAANRTEALRETVAGPDVPDSADPRLALARAWLHRRDGDDAAARRVLDASHEIADQPGLNAERAALLGALCDGDGDRAAAFRHFAASGRHALATPAGRAADAARYRARIDSYRLGITADRVSGWRGIAVDDRRADPVFLVGFPRSGTTLLDTALFGHPGIAVVEEKSAIDTVRNRMEARHGTGPDALAALTAADIAAMRRDYFRIVDAALGKAAHGRVVVDKQPLNLVEAALIHRLFPHARFLLALRHPADCVLSCFMQNFALNDAMANLTTIADAAALYDRTMTLWQHYRAVLPLEVHELRYEALVGDFDRTVGDALAFIGVDWDANVRNFNATALARGRVDTPSYAQVTRPLSVGAIGRWRRYRAEMAPVLPGLLAWAARLDYPTD